MTSKLDPSQLHKFVLEQLKKRGRSEPLSLETSLFTTGLLDSIAGIELILFLEKNYHLDFYDKNLELADLDSIAKILAILRIAP